MKSKNNNDLISVIMSTKSTEENMLRYAIESILNQTYKNIEFIITCDGDEADLKIVQSYKDDRIIINYHKDSCGLTKSLNEMIKMSKGKYIARMDSDDYSLPNRLMEQYILMEKNSSIDICSTLVKYFGDEDRVKINLYNKFDGVKENLFIYNHIFHPSVMMRKEFLDKNGLLYNEEFIYSQDYELWSRSCFLGNFYIIPKILLLYRRHGNQISSAKLETQNNLCKKIYTDNLKRLSIEPTEKNIDYLFYLTKRSKNKYSTKEIVDFIEYILNQNKKNHIYDGRILGTLLFKTLALVDGNIPKKYIIKYNLIFHYLKQKILSIILSKNIKGCVSSNETK